MSISAGLPGVFQNAYYGSLFGSATGGGLGASQGSSLGGLGFGGMVPGIASGSGMMANNMNPLAGHSALRGLGDFTSQVMYTGALRQMGYLPTTRSSGGMSGGGGGTQSMMQQLMQMFGMLQAMTGGQEANVPASTGSFGQAQTTPASFGGAQAIPASFGGAQAMPVSFGGGDGFSGGFGGGGSFGGNSLFSRVGDGFFSIDSAISQTLGSIFNTLPLARL